MPEETVKTVPFGDVLIALKKGPGMKAARTSWKTNTQYIVGSYTDKGAIKGIVMSMNGVLGAAGLHHDDLLADDWELFT